jgi:hypothetical protein
VTSTTRGRGRAAIRVTPLRADGRPAPPALCYVCAMPTPLRRRPFDLLLVATFALFAFTSLVMEMYIVFGVDLRDPGSDPFARAWALYCTWDPIFLDTPLWLRIMCGIDGFVFGPFYLVLVWALAKERAWIQLPALLYAAAIVYSTIVYFGYEFIAEAGRADMTMVVLVNIPYTIMPLALAWRMWPRRRRLRG